ncbi:hypothetical protein WICMUC_004631 [Wickerhamomyces mucosus]|uniref:CCAAT-binding factor domain-containing protein n=1 Tax=Wickerhamomyces mucosus TaxID=1378264 RepID=A0A9P8TAL3_9ASCO|nr:hypothetical protein WICMUC_004631 [Wickerhamomyces mucosus]
MVKRSKSNDGTPSKKSKPSNQQERGELSKDFITIQTDQIIENLNKDVSNIKSLIDLYDIFLETFQSQDEQEDEILTKYEDDLRYLNVSIFKIFSKAFNDQLFDNKLSKIYTDLKKFYELFKFNLLFFMEIISIDCSLIVDNLDIYMKLLKFENLNFNGNQPYFPNKSFKDLIHTLINSNNGEILSNGLNSNIILQEFLTNYYSKYYDLQFYFINELNLIELNHSSNLISKILTIINEKTMVLDIDQKKKKCFLKKLPSLVNNLNHYKNQFELNLLSILNHENQSILLNSQYKTILLILHKRIIPFMKTPTKLMDFLTDSYNLNDTLISILSLNGLFELIKTYNLDYPNFYTKLYQLLDKNLFHLKYRSRFLRLTDIFLNSTHLPSSLIASFIKKMARLSINSSPSAIVSIIPFIYNLLKRHPTCMILLQNEHTDSLYSDPYNNDEIDPLKTNAIESSLWELETLQSHYHPNVATLAKIFSQPFKKQSYNLEDFLDWSYNSLLESETTRRLKEDGAALEYEEFETLLGDYLPEWRW